MRAVVVCAAVACSGGHPAEPITGHAAAPRAARMIVYSVSEPYEGGGVALVRVTREGVEVLAPKLSGRAFGWLDEHDFVVLDYEDGGVLLTRYRDGHGEEVTRVPEGTWPETTFLELAVTQANEAWLVKCVVQNYGCTGAYRYLRVHPQPKVPSETAPAGLETDRAVNDENNPWPRPPATGAPPGMSIALADVPVTVIDVNSGKPDHVETRPGVRCTANGKTRTYPEEAMLHEVARNVRWVSAEPAILEIELDVTYLGGNEHVTRYLYARACEPSFEGYAWLGDDLWASFMQDHHDPPFDMEQTQRHDGDWIFHAGDHVIGKTHGFTPMRPNLFR